MPIRRADGADGCADGRRADTAPPAAAADRLAYYASNDLWVLAPRGWHCFGLYGSNGETLIVTPEAHDGDDFLKADLHLKGPAIQLSNSIGSTSGRFEVAQVGARLFPVAKPFVEQVIQEGPSPRMKFTSGPDPGDLARPP